MKPTLIHSKILNETICLSDEPVAGQICYSEKEIKFLRACEKNMKPERYADYLRKVHSVKKAFPESKIEDVKMEARQEDVAGKPFREESTDLRVEDAEEPVAPTIPAQKSLWED